MTRYWTALDEKEKYKKYGPIQCFDDDTKQVFSLRRQSSFIKSMPVYDSCTNV